MQNFNFVWWQTRRVNTQKQPGFNVSHSLLSLYILLILWHVHRPCVSSSHDACTTPVSGGHVRAHVSYMCGGMWRGETKHTPKLRKGHWWSTQVSLAKFLFHICFIFPCQNGAVSHEKTSRKSVSDGEIIRAEWVLINDSVEGGAGNVTLPQVSTTLNVTSKAEQKGYDLIWCTYVFVCVHVYTQYVSLQGLNLQCKVKFGKLTFIKETLSGD